MDEIANEEKKMIQERFWETWTNEWAETIREWIVAETQYDGQITPGQIEHVAGCIESVVQHLTGKRPGGDFAQAVARKDWEQAFHRADMTNLLSMYLYHRWMFMYAPIGLVTLEQGGQGPCST